ncbi:MAG: ATP-binding protein [Actinobacteria bacterium]|nr:ATP-binding protein [Actinomycetota bacterium]
MTNKEQKIFPISLVLESMKDSGYKDAAHAVAELIDNSIQAGEELQYPVEVELICIEENNFLNDRQSRQIHKIAVYDNASGMSPDVLHKALAFGEGTRRGANQGIGKFGMGLPNASISQCSRVDVWSWQNNECYHAYLDLNELMQSGNDTLPFPLLSSVPKEWIGRIKGATRDSGTLIVWSELDRLKWKRHRAFFLNTEFIVGRMYRYFLNNNSCSIRMAAYSSDGEIFEEYVKPNDPLYRMLGTNTPAPFDHKAGFVDFGDEEEITIKHRGHEHKVYLRFSVADQEFRKNFNLYYDGTNYKNPGSTPFGKHCQKNLGISVVRSGRELELNNTFNIQYDPVERWWGAEIRFEAALDDVFGVTNNKQAATAFKQTSTDDISIEEEIGKSEVKNYLRDQQDPRLHIIEISELISSKLHAIRGELTKQREGARAKQENSVKNAAEIAASETAKKDGLEGESDRKGAELSPEEKERELLAELAKYGVSPDDDEIKQVIQTALNNDDKFIISTSDMRGADIIFDVTQPAGKLKVTINESHTVYKNLISHLEESEDGSVDIVKLLFASWALMEDREQDVRMRDQLLEIRKEWGQYAKKMLNEYLK